MDFAHTDIAKMLDHSLTDYRKSGPSLNARRLNSHGGYLE